MFLKKFFGLIRLGWQLHNILMTVITQPQLKLFRTEFSDKTLVALIVSYYLIVSR